MILHRRTLEKPDGRALILYGREPIPKDIEAPAAGTRTAAHSHLR